MRSLSALLTLLLLIPATSSARAELRFVENKGQFIDTDGNPRPDVLFVAEAPGVRIYLRRTGISYVLISDDTSAHGRSDRPRGTQLRLDAEFDGSSPAATVVGGEMQPGVYNYYLPHCRDGITGVRSFGRVTYSELYPGIDLVVYSSARGMKYDFVVRLGGDPSRIGIRYDGALSLCLEPDSSLQVTTVLGVLREFAPMGYRDSLGTRVPVSCSYRLSGNRLGFGLSVDGGAFPLTIDPELVWGTLLGGGREESMENGSNWSKTAPMAVSGPGGSVTTTATTWSGDLPVTVGSVQPVVDSNQIFAARVSADGRSLVWSTVLGRGFGWGVAVDSSGCTYVGCESGFATFPVTVGAFQVTFGGSGDGVIAKLDTSGVLLWSTFYGAATTERVLGLAVDSQGALLVAMVATSNTLTTPGAYRTASNSSDLLLAKFSGTGARQWATFVGGVGWRSSLSGSVCVDDSSNIYVAGQTQIAGFPTTTGAYQRSNAGGFDAFLMKFSASGGLQWSTLLGGSGDDVGTSCAPGGDGLVFVSGFTESSDLPVTDSAFQRTRWSGPSTKAYDGFLGCFSSSGSLRWLSYYGGDSIDVLTAVTADRHGNASATGITFSSDLPVTGDALQAARSGPMDPVIVRFDSTGRRLWATHFGGSGRWTGPNEHGQAIDGRGAYLYVGGTATSTDFPTTTGAYQTSYAGGHSDLFLARFCALTPTVWPRYPEICAGDTIALFAPEGYRYLWSTGDTTQSIRVARTGSFWFRASEGDCVGYSDTVAVVARALPVLAVQPAGPISLCAGDTATLDAGVHTSYEWSTGDTTRTSRVAATGRYTVAVTNQYGCTARDTVDVVVHALPRAAIASSAPKICPDDSVTLSAPAGYPGYTWSTRQTTRQIRVGREGTYWMQVTDSNGCTSRADTIRLEMYPRPEVSITPATPMLCPDDSLQLSGPAGFVGYRWSTGATTRSVTLRDTGRVWLEVTDSNGCRARTPWTAVGRYTPPKVKVLAFPSPSFCEGDSAVLVAPPGYVSYRWSSGERTSMIVARQTGRYEVETVDSNGCRQRVGVDVQVRARPRPRLERSGVAELCDGQTMRLRLREQYSQVEWSGGARGAELEVGSPGLYFATVTEPSGCSGVSDTLELRVHPRPSSAIDGPAAICTGAAGEYAAPGRPGVGYRWSVAGGSVENMSGSGLRVRWSTAGTGRVELIATDSATGCADTASMEITIGSTLVPQVRLTGRATLCPGDSVELDAGSGYAEYQWSTGERTRRIVVRQPGDYTVQVKDAQGCSGTSQPVSIRSVPAPEPRISAATLEPCEGDSVELDAGAHASYRWSTGDTTRRLTVSRAGNYHVSVRSSAGCWGTSPAVTVTLRRSPRPEIDGPNGVCIGGEAEYAVGDTIAEPVNWTVSGGTIVAGQGTRRITVRWGAAGSGQVRAESVTNGCRRGERSDVTIDAELHPRVTPAGPVMLCEGETVELVAPGGYASYRWSTGETTRRLVVRAAGEYRVDVQSAEGCSGRSEAVVVLVVERPRPAITPSEAEICAGDSVELDAGGGYLRYAWSTGDTTRRVWVRSGGSVGVEVVSLIGECRGRSPDVVVRVVTPVVPVITGTGDELESTPAASYQWYRDGVAVAGADARRHRPEQAGRYRVRTVDSSGCSAESEEYVHGRVARAMLTLADLEARPGDTVSMPVRLESSEHLDAAGAWAWQMTVRFNRTLLLPVGSTPMGMVQGRERIVEVTGSRSAGVAGGELGRLEFIAALGDTSVTSVEVERFWFTGAEVQIAVSSGSVRIVSRGGWVGLHGDGRLRLEVRPNPARSDEIDVEYELIEPGRARLGLFDVLGREREVYVDEESKPGIVRLRLDVRHLASGTYHLVLRTPSGTMTVPVTVMR